VKDRTNLAHARRNAHAASREDTMVIVEEVFTQKLITGQEQWTIVAPKNRLRVLDSVAHMLPNDMRSFYQDDNQLPIDGVTVRPVS
jgi:hypothetical protein